MKNILLPFSLGLSLNLTAAQPDSTNSPSSPSPIPPPSATPAPAVAPGYPLTPDEDKEVNQAHGDALFADPSLVAEERLLWTKFKAARDAGQRPGADLKAELTQYNTKLYAAMIKIDPKVAPLLIKLHPAKQPHP